MKEKSGQSLEQDAPSEAEQQSLIESAIRKQIEKMREDLQKVDPYCEQALKEFCREFMERFGGDVPGTALDRIRNPLVTQRKYPGEFVVFFDEELTVDGEKTIVRNVEFHSRDSDACFRFMRQQNNKKLEISFQPTP